MKKFSFIFVLGFLALSFNSFSQLRVDSNGNATVKYGNLSSGNDAILYLGDTNHYIKSVWGSGVRIGTAGSIDVIRLTQWDSRVGINRDPSYTLDVSGTLRVNTTLYSSDERYKTDIKDLGNPIDKIKLAKGVSYKFSLEKEKNKKENNRNFGFIAQDFQKVFPELVYEDSLGYLSIDYVSMIPVLLEAVKKQQEDIEELKALLANIESKK